MTTMTEVELRLARLASQRLVAACADDAATPSQVVADVCGVQAQDHGSALAGVCVRRRGLVAEQVERDLVEGREIAITWLMRGTLHLVAAEDLPWLVGLLGPLNEKRIAWRLRQLGVSDPDIESGTAAIADALTAGPLTKAEIAEALVRQGLLPDAAGQRPIHFIGLAAARGALCLGPRRGARRTYALLREWLGVGVDMAAEERQRRASATRLGRRYLAAFGPAGPADFAFWSGLPAREARAAFAAIEDQTEAVRVDGRTDDLRALRGSRALTCAPSRPSGERIDLPSWDNYLMGYADRSFALGPDAEGAVTPNGGVLLRAVIEDGLVVGRWGGAVTPS